VGNEMLHLHERKSHLLEKKYTRCIGIESMTQLSLEETQTMCSKTDCRIEIHTTLAKNKSHMLKGNWLTTWCKIN